MEALVIKGIINIAGIAVGALCIWIGYRLYVRGVLETGKANAEGAGFKMALASYGPGVIFAMFGAFIVIFSLTRGMSLHTKQTYTEDGRVIEESTKADAINRTSTVETMAEATSAPPESSPGEAPAANESTASPAQ